MYNAVITQANIDRIRIQYTTTYLTVHPFSDKRVVVFLVQLRLVTN